ncbi:MAG: PD40 domain-containing protein [Alphaproteobacteria bacterium]|nr:PD40 domain-containing protein [Alphaproteobacteria bacterium]
MSILLILAGAACTGSGTDNGVVENLDGDVVALRLEPDAVEAEVTTGDPVEVDFAAIATFESGVEAEIDLVAWSSSNLSAGEIDADGVFTSVDTNGGVTLVTAAHLGIEATAEVRVVYTEDVVADGADAGLVAAFDAASPTTGASPALLYPSDGVRVPRNLEGLGFLWDAPTGANAHRLRLRSDITDISVFTLTDTSWFATAALWEQISAANRNGEVEVTVASGTWSGSALTDVVEGPPITLTVNRLDARGSVLYWSTAVRGIMRIPFGSDQAEVFWGDFPDDSCYGCHVVSEITDEMVISHDGISGMFSILDVGNPDNPFVRVAHSDDRRITFKTVSPDGRYLLATNEGVFSLYSMETGERLRTYSFPDPYSQPDFSPDGESVVAVRIVREWENEFFFRGGEIVILPWNDGDLGDPQVVVPGDPVYNYYYPAWSPDGAWIAYNRTIGRGYASRDAELYLVNPEGDLNIRLSNANGEGTGLQNSYPRWGPLPDDDVLWLAYSSLRDYAIDDRDEPQIWVTAIDTEAASAGQDPSSAPFWLPGQRTDADNHLPYWWKL